MSWRSGVLSAANWVMAALFVAAAAVQLNDPDPVRWIALYGAAAAGCLLFRRAAFAWSAQAALAAVALAWCLLLLGHLGGVVDSRAFFDLGMKMRGDATERAREAGGLAIVAAWMAMLAFSGFRSRRR